MSNSADVNDDEYVAKLLAEDARKSSLRYSSMGMSALLPKRPTGSAPKPNTRFLKTLVREADSHNAALKKKEELEARIRLRKIREDEISKGQPSKHDSRGERGYNRERASKRQRLDDEQDHHSHSGRHRHSRRHRRRNSSSERSEGLERRHRDRRGYYDSDGDDDADRHKSRHHKSSKRHRSRSSDRRDDEREQARYKHRSKPNPLSSSPERTQHLPSNRQNGERHRPESSPRPSNDHKQRARRLSSSSTTSDPLTSLIGPAPPNPSTNGSPTIKRGRGFCKPQPTSNIDHHFSSNYNPSHDASASPDVPSDGEDWDNALEALRDRRAWRAKQADRMREAGFKDDEIERWETSASKTTLLSETDGDIRDVKWRKRGEGREWDEGKVSFDDDDNDDKPRVKPYSSSKRTSASPPTNNDKPRPKPRTDANLDVWRRKDSGFMKQFRKALG